MNLDRLETLAAVVDAGSFEQAAAALNLTPSAVSQRIKALEASAGQVLVERTVPCRPTQAGAVLVRTARQVAVLSADALAALGSDDGGPSPLAVAVNADSLATWFADVVRAAAAWPDSALQLHVQDESLSKGLLRSGDVVAAVTSDPSPVSGCRVEPLGAMRYLPVAAPELVARHQVDGRVDLVSMPVLRFNRDDDLQHAFLREQLHITSTAPCPQVPSSEGFRDAVRAGVGWGLLPTAQLGDDLQTGRLVRLAGRRHRDVPLFWQAWTIHSPRIDRLADAVRAAARAGLRPTR